MTARVLTDKRVRRLEAKWQDAPLVGWRQLCAITRAAYAPEHGEWSERVKRDLARLGFRYEPEAVARAIRVLEHVIGQPLPTLAKPVAMAKPSCSPPLTPRETAALLKTIRDRVAARQAES